MLAKLVRETSSAVEHTVISLRGKGSVGPIIEECGARVHSWNLQGVIDSLGAFPSIAQTVMESRPDVIQGWMYHGNLVASLISIRMGMRCPVSWSIRCTLDSFPERLRTRMLMRTEALLSRSAKSIVYNSTRALGQHEAIGYAKRGVVLPNGFDVKTFCPDPNVRALARRKLGIDAESFVVGYIGRLAPVKDLPTFLAAMGLFMTARNAVTAVVVGRGIPQVLEKFPEFAQSVFRLEGRLKLLPEVSETVSLFNAFDVLVLSSSAEGFPNVIGEAMACGVPCVATDVGDCRSVIGDTGYLVPTKNPHAIAGALLKLVDMDAIARAKLGVSCRKRIVENFSLPVVAKMYLNGWRQLAP